MSDLVDALDAMTWARPGYIKAAAYAHGPINEVFASRRLKRLLRNHEVTFQTVLGGVVINAVADKLKITNVATDNDTANVDLEEQEKRNKMALLRPYVMKKALEFGDAYLLAWPELDDNGAETGNLTISYNDPRTVRILYDADNPTEKRLLIKRWGTSDKRVRVDLIYPDKIRHYRSKQPNGRASKANDFEEFTPDGATGPEEDNPYGIPAFHFTTTMPGEYGEPEHKLFYGTQDKLNKLTVSHMGGVDYYSIPQRAAILEAGADTSEAAQMDEDEFIVSPDGARTDHVDGEGRANITGEPGSLWMQKGIKSYHQFDVADPDAFLKPEVQYLQEGAIATSTPPHMFTAKSTDFPTGKALRTANAPLDNKADARQASFDATWEEFYLFVLKLLGYEGVSVTITWDPVQTVDEDEKLANAAKKQEIGVPADQTLREVGYDPGDVDRWMIDGNGLLPQRISQFAELATALRDITAPVAAGVIDQATVQALVAKLFEDVSNDNPDAA